MSVDRPPTVINSTHTIITECEPVYSQTLDLFKQELHRQLEEHLQAGVRSGILTLTPDVELRATLTLNLKVERAQTV